MIQYIIAAGIGAFLGSQSKKSKKSYAEGGKTDESARLQKAIKAYDDYLGKIGLTDDDVYVSEGYGLISWSDDVKQKESKGSFKSPETAYEDVLKYLKREYPQGKKMAKGGKVELHKHPQGHWMLINPLSFQVGEDFVNEQDAKDYAWNNGIELTNSSYAKGGLTQVDKPPYYMVSLINWNKNINRVSGRFRTEDEAKKKAEKLKEKYKERTDFNVEITFYDDNYNKKKVEYAKGGVTPHYNVIALEHRHNLQYGDSQRFATEKEAIEWGMKQFKSDDVGLVEIDRVRANGLTDMVFRINDTYPLGERVVMKPYAKGGFTAKKRKYYSDKQMKDLLIKRGADKKDYKSIFGRSNYNFEQDWEQVAVEEGFDVDVRNYKWFKKNRK